MEGNLPCLKLKRKEGRGGRGSGARGGWVGHVLSAVKVQGDDVSACKMVSVRVPAMYRTRCTYYNMIMVYLCVLYMQDLLRWHPLQPHNLRQPGNICTHCKVLCYIM